MVRAQSIKLPTEIMISVNECMKNDAVQSAPGIVNLSFATVRISMKDARIQLHELEIGVKEKMMQLVIGEKELKFESMKVQIQNS